MKKVLSALTIGLFALAVHAQPVAETCGYQYLTLDKGGALEMNADYILYCMDDMISRVELWSYQTHELYDDDIEGAEFFVYGDAIYIVSFGGTASGNQRTIIQKFSLDGTLLKQVQIPNKWNHVSFMQIAPDRIVTNSHDSLYLFTFDLQLEKKIKGPDRQINDFDVYNGHIFALVENQAISDYNIVEYDSNLDSVGSEHILLDAPGYECNAFRIGLNRTGEVFVNEFWNIDPPTDRKVVFRKFDAAMNEVWESPGDTLFANPEVFAPLDDGGILVSNTDMMGNRIDKIDKDGVRSLFLEGWIGIDYETDSSYSFVNNCGGYQFSKNGYYLPWYHKVYIEHVAYMNPSGALCFPDPPKGVHLQLDAGYPGSEGGVTWSDGVNENPHVVYSPGAYYANFTFLEGNIGYTDTFVVEDHYALVDKPEFDLEYDGTLHICEGTSLEIGIALQNDNGSDYTYEIENYGTFDETVSLGQEGSYTIIVTDGYGCFTDTTIDLTLKRPYAESICMVTVDSVTDKNAIVWKKTPGQATVGYTITRGYGHTEIGTQDFSGVNYLVDQSSNPDIQAYRYFITSTDTCGNSAMSEISHKTLHLTANVGTSGEVNLIWEPYLGVDVYQYNFYRSTDGKDFKLIGAMEYDPDITQYSDYDHPFWRLFYKIGIVGNFACELETAKKSSMEPTSEIFSNTKLMYPTGLESPDSERRLEVYPNPAHATLFVKTRNNGDRVLALKIVSQVGAVLYETTFKGDEVTVDLPAGIENGMYFLSVSGFKDGGQAIRKILVASY